MLLLRLFTLYLQHAACILLLFHYIGDNIFPYSAILVISSPSLTKFNIKMSCPPNTIPVRCNCYYTKFVGDRCFMELQNRKTAQTNVRLEISHTNNLFITQLLCVWSTSLINTDLLASKQFHNFDLKGNKLFDFSFFGMERNWANFKINCLS